MKSSQLKKEQLTQLTGTFNAMDDFEKELEEITQAAGETVVTHFSREIHIDPAVLPGASEMDLKGAKVGAKCETPRK